MSETFNRQWAILKMIPRFPRTIDSGTIRGRLRDEGLGNTHIRTIQRDLEMLSGSFPLGMVDPDQRPIQWQWIKGAAPLEIPALDPAEALTMKMVETHLRSLLPGAMLDALAPHFQAANRTLGGEGGQGLARWTRRVRVLPKGMQLLPPKVDPVVQSAVYDALLREKQLEVSYRPRAATEDSNYKVSPLALVVRNDVVYVVVARPPHENPFQLVLHRIKAAKVLEDSVNEPRAFDLDKYIEKGEFGWPAGKKIRLDAVFSPGAAKTLSETPLSVDQMVRMLDDGQARITATVLDTVELKWWLMSFGPEVEVFAPKKLRRQMAEAISAVATRYK